MERDERAREGTGDGRGGGGWGVMEVGEELEGRLSVGVSFCSGGLLRLRFFLFTVDEKLS